MIRNLILAVVILSAMVFIAMKLIQQRDEGLDHNMSIAAS